MSKNDASEVMPCVRFATDKIMGKYDIIHSQLLISKEMRKVATKSMAVCDYYLEYKCQLCNCKKEI